jgi:hypothetical protein
MRATDLLRAAVLVTAGLCACAGGGSTPRAPDEPPPRAGVADPAAAFQDLLARLDILIADHDGDGSVSGVLLAEARALRIQALSALAAGDNALAHDFLVAAIALFGEGAP